MLRDALKMAGLVLALSTRHVPTLDREMNPFRPTPRGGYAVAVSEQESVRVPGGEAESVLEELREPMRLLEKSSGRPSPRGSSAA